MFRVGLTGGIGSGKTIVCKIFEILGVPVYDADFRAKIMMSTHPEIIAGLSELFGNEILNDGRPDREKIASIVFYDRNALNLINSLIHPYVRKDFDLWSRSKLDSAYVIEEAAILFETGAYQLLDFTIAVTAPDDLRISRVVERDHVERKDVLARIANQMDEEDKIRMADAVIINDNTKLVIPQVVELHFKLLDLAAEK